jgi:hypothetical protein
MGDRDGHFHDVGMARAELLREDLGRLRFKFTGIVE